MIEAPKTAAEFLESVLEQASVAIGGGWTVNVAMESGGTQEAFTLSASKTRAPAAPGTGD